LSLEEGLPSEVIPILQRRNLFRTEYEGSMLREHYGLPWPKRSSMIPTGQPSRCRPLPACDRCPVARHRNRGETLALATDVLVIGGGPSAAWAAVGTAAACALINSTDASGQAMAVLHRAHRQHPTDRDALMARSRETPGILLRHARELVTLDSADTRLRSVVSDLENRPPLAVVRFAAPVDELNYEREVRNCAGFWTPATTRL
jgi:hypothetical protein